LVVDFTNFGHHWDLGTPQDPAELASLVPGDPEQIVDHLLANVLDFTPPGVFIALSANGDRGQVSSTGATTGPT
jgi:hypothetical protein